MSNVRRSLQLTREIVASPHVGIQDLVKAYSQRSTLVADQENIKLAIIEGRYDIYVDINKPFVKNIFNIGTGSDTTPLLGARLLSYFNELWGHNPDNDGRYISVRDTCTYFHAIGIEPHISNSWLEGLFNAGLLLTYNPQIKSLSPEVRLEIAPSGRQHLSWALKDWVYLESMAEVTPLLNSDTMKDIQGAIEGRSSFKRRQVIRVFIEYLLSEDAIYCKYIVHPSYSSQTQIISRLEHQRELTARHLETGRYARFLGRIAGWNPDKGFGFINRTSGERIFVHLRNIVDFRHSDSQDGALVEYDIEEGERGLVARNVLRKKNDERSRPLSFEASKAAVRYVCLRRNQSS